MADLGYIAFYPLLYVGIVLLLRSRSPLDRRHALARRDHGRVRGRGARRRDPRRARSRGHGGLDVDRRDEPRLPARRRAPAVGRLRRLLAHRLAARAALAAPRPRPPRDGARGRHLPVPVVDGPTWKATWIDILWPHRAPAHRLLGVDARPHARAALEVEGRPLLAVPAVCALVATGILVYDHFMRVNLLAIVLASSTLALVVVRLAADVPREQPPLRADARRRRRPTRSPASGTAGSSSNDLAAPSRRQSRWRRRSSCSSTSTASRATTTRSATRPGTRCSSGWARSSPPSRASGAAYRLGGDEFCLLRAVGEGDAEPLIDRACEASPSTARASRSRAPSAPSSSRTRRPTPARAAGRRRAALCAEVLAPRRERANDGGAPRGACRPASRSSQAKRRRRRHAGRRHRADARAAPRRARRPRARGPAPRPREARRARTRSSTSPGRSTSASGRSSASTRSWESASSALRRRCAASRSIVRSSHENWDGSGYPDGLVGEESPLASRIIRVCNAFVAMISERPYRDASLGRRGAERAHAPRRHRVRPDRRPRLRRARPRRARGRASGVASGGHTAREAP